MGLIKRLAARCPRVNGTFMTEFLIALGTNLPIGGDDLASTLHRAIRVIERTGAITIGAVSPFYRTPAWPAGSGPDFVNAAAMLRSALDPAEILDHLHRVEADMGRTRAVRWAPRVCDLDLLAADDLVLPDPRDGAALDRAAAGEAASSGAGRPDPAAPETARARPSFWFRSTTSRLPGAIRFWASRSRR